MRLYFHSLWIVNCLFGCFIRFLALFAEYGIIWCAWNAITWDNRLCFLQTTQLRDYLRENSREGSVNQRVLGYIVVAWVARKHDIKFLNVVDKRGPWVCILEGLTLPTMDENIFKHVYGTLCNLGAVWKWVNVVFLKLLLIVMWDILCYAYYHVTSYAKHICRNLKLSLDFLVERMEYEPQCLLILPLYYVLLNNGSCTFMKETWKEANTQFKTKEVLKKCEDTRFQK